MPSRAAALLGDMEGGVSSRLSWMRSSYDFLTVALESRRIIYRGDSCISDEMEPLLDCSVDGDSANFSIGETGIGMFLMVTLPAV